jgi:hypothetical protein
MLVHTAERHVSLIKLLTVMKRDRDAWALLSFAVELCEHFVRNFGGDFEFSGVELMLRL